MVKVGTDSRKEGGFATYGLIILMTMVLIIWQGVSREVVVANAGIADERAYREGYYRTEAAVVMLLANMHDGEAFTRQSGKVEMYKEGDWHYYYNGRTEAMGRPFRIMAYGKKDGDFHSHYRRLWFVGERDEEGKPYFRLLKFE